MKEYSHRNRDIFSSPQSTQLNAFPSSPSFLPPLHLISSTSSTVCAFAFLLSSLTQIFSRVAFPPNIFLWLNRIILYGRESFHEPSCHCRSIASASTVGISGVVWIAYARKSITWLPLSGMELTWMPYLCYSPWNHMAYCGFWKVGSMKAPALGYLWSQTNHFGTKREGSVHRGDSGLSMERQDSRDFGVEIDPKERVNT